MLNRKSLMRDDDQNPVSSRFRNPQPSFVRNVTGSQMIHPMFLPLEFPP
jgi:hypothetical protein